MDHTLPVQLQFRVVTPERLVVHDSVSAITIPGKEGYLGVLPGHAPLLTELRPGEVSYIQGDTTEYLAVSWGIAEVLPDRVILLAQTAERAQEIDLDRAERAWNRAAERLKKYSDPETDMERARAALEKALARIQAARRLRA